jgi:hypothetical protein
MIVYLGYILMPCGWKIFDVVECFVMWHIIFYHVDNGLEWDFRNEVHEG